jgi:hypothetical protein
MLYIIKTAQQPGELSRLLLAAQLDVLHPI